MSLKNSKAIEIKKVQKNFGKVQALKDVNIQINKGEIFGFLGPNGAGKTTTIRCIMDYIRPTSGHVKIFGKDSRKDSAYLKSLIGFLSADGQLYETWTGKQHLDFIFSIRGESDKYLKLSERLGLNLNAKVKNLSSGNKQKLAIVLAFSSDPKLIIMDEPTRGLDPLLQIELYSMINDYRKSGGTVFLSSHNLPEVQKICDRVSVIKDGSVIKTADLDKILEVQTHIIFATTKKPIPEKLLIDNNFRNIKTEGKQTHFKVIGNLDKALSILNSHDVTDLEVSHASLEDVFMEFYK